MRGVLPAMQSRGDGETQRHKEGERHGDTDTMRQREIRNPGHY